MGSDPTGLAGSAKPGEGEQCYANHRRIVPMYHFAIFGTFVLNLVWRLVQLVKHPSFDALVGLAMALAFIGLFFYARLFALTAQDRTIRLEEQLRLARLLPDDLKERIPELTAAQLIALRFAADTEIPSLVRVVLNEKLGDRETIKRRIQNWRADHLRV